jgi:hypothetical protein
MVYQINLGKQVQQSQNGFVTLVDHVGNEFRHTPNVICETCFHSGDNAYGSVYLTEILPREMECHNHF